MTVRSVAETLPELYRSILDVVADLEATGHRREALRVRARAARAYGKAWDGKAQSTLEGLHARAVRIVEQGTRPDAPAASARGPVRALIARASGRASA